MSDDPAGLGSPGGGASQRPEGGRGPRVIERLDERECLRLIGAGRLGRLAYTGRFGPTVLPVLYKLHEGAIFFRTVQDTFTEEDLRTGIAHADYQVGFEVDQYDPETLDGWVVLVVGRHMLWTPMPSARRSSAPGTTRGPRPNPSTWSGCSPLASAAAAGAGHDASSSVPAAILTASRQGRKAELLADKAGNRHERDTASPQRCS